MKKSIIFILLMFGSYIWGAEYTLDECFNAALKNDYSLSILKDEIAIKLLDRNDSLSSYYPVINTVGNIQFKSEAPELDLSTLGIPGGGTAELGTQYIFDFNININQIIFDGFSHKYGIMLSENNLNMTRLDHELKEDMIHQTLLQLAYSYTMSKLNIETLSTSIKRLEFNMNQVKLFVDQGFSSELDLLDIKSKLKEQEQHKLNLESGMRKILYRIAGITGISDIDSLIIPSKYLELLEPGNPAELEEKLEANGELLRYDITHRQIEIRSKIAEAAFYPSIFGTGSVHYGLPGTNLTGSEWQLYYTAGIQIKLNLWDGGRKTNVIRRINLLLNQNSKSRDSYMRNLYFDTMQKLDELISLQERRVEAADIYVLKKKKYEIIGNLWKAGQKSTIDVLSAEQEFTEADIREKNLRIQYLSLYQQILFNINES